MRYFQILILLLAAVSLSACQSSTDKEKLTGDDKRASLHYRLGIDALHKGLLPKAFEELMFSEQINPNQPETLDAIAYAWRVRGNNKQPKAYYEKAINADAGAVTHNNYGSLLIEMGEYQSAVDHLNIALEDPRYRNQALAFTNLGDAQVGLNQFDNAIKSYRKAALISPNWSLPQLREAEAYIKFDRPNYARALYETILRKEPNNQAALEGLIGLVKGRGENKLLREYVAAFSKHELTTELQKAWAKDEMARLK